MGPHYHRDDVTLGPRATAVVSTNASINGATVLVHICNRLFWKRVRVKSCSHVRPKKCNITEGRVDWVILSVAIETSSLSRLVCVPQIYSFYCVILSVASESSSLPRWVCVPQI